MLKAPLWLIEQIAKGSKVDPASMLSQTTIDDLFNLIHHFIK